MLSRIIRVARKVLSIDLRTLAVFRMGLALVILHDLLLRVFDLEAHYTDRGTFPRILCLEFNELQRFSLHLMTGTLLGQALLFAVQAVVAVALLLGWKTRIAALLSWVFLVSLHNRNPSLLGGGDILLRLLSFWSLFLPMGAKFSWDGPKASKAWGEGNRKVMKDPSFSGKNHVFSLASAAILLQVALVYWFTVVLKNHEEWRVHGTAVYNALQIDQLTTSLAPYFLRFPTFLQWVTKGVLYFEVVGPLIAFSPWWQGPLRTGVVAAFLFFHCVALALTMNLGIFPYVCFLAWILFLPSWFWEKFPWSKTWENGRDISEITPTQNQENTGPRFWRPASLWPWASSLTLSFLFIYIVLWNVREVDREKWDKLIPRNLEGLAYALALDQNWALFAPHPYKDDGWYVMPGTLRNGEVVEVFQGQMKGERTVHWGKPALVYDSFPNRRWAKYLRNLWYGQYEKLRIPFSQFICRLWGEEAKGEMEKLEFFEIYYMKEETPPPGRAVGEPEKILLWQHYCL